MKKPYNWRPAIIASLSGAALAALAALTGIGDKAPVVAIIVILGFTFWLANYLWNLSKDDE